MHDASPFFALVLLAAPTALAGCSRDDVAPTAAASAAPSASAAASPPSSAARPLSDAGATTPAAVSKTAGACALRPACDAPLPALAAARGFRHKRSTVIATAASPAHRGRDLFVRPEGAQWAIAKIAYGVADKDLEDEDVDVWLLRDCGSSWEKVGTYRSSGEGAPVPAQEGVEDTGGRVYVNLGGSRTDPATSAPATVAPLAVGRHRVRFVVAGDLTGTDLFLEVLAPAARVAVSDVDGTLTSSETAAWTDIAGATPPDANPGAPEALTALAGRGYHLFYLTARPEWLVQKSREWLSLRGFPPGILHTTLTGTGTGGPPAARFKASELEALKASVGVVPEFAFGNMPSDVETYRTARVDPSRCYYFKLAGDLGGGVAHDDYARLVPALAAGAASCP